MTQATEKDIGKWCKFYLKNEVYHIAILNDIIDCDSRFDDGFHLYENCEPLTQEQIKVLGLEE